jgi:hypothetical protein
VRESVVGPDDDGRARGSSVDQVCRQAEVQVAERRGPHDPVSEPEIA